MRARALVYDIPISVNPAHRLLKNSSRLMKKGLERYQKMDEPHDSQMLTTQRRPNVVHNKQLSSENGAELCRTHCSRALVLPEGLALPGSLGRVMPFIPKWPLTVLQLKDTLDMTRPNGSTNRLLSTP